MFAGIPPNDVNVSPNSPRPSLYTLSPKSLQRRTVSPAVITALIVLSVGPGNSTMLDMVRTNPVEGV